MLYLTLFGSVKLTGGASGWLAASCKRTIDCRDLQLLPVLPSKGEALGCKLINFPAPWRKQTKPTMRKIASGFVQNSNEMQIG